ncbi:hypothetical protein HALLA_12265 [Halostagnicola larsenii XH-48]|uniref:Ribbon-helix-helix protein CopG domain-containing protein n=1 Tax=Halostagnicola larsenii XH-48 TaxID=797299 RepID=W0JV77_9EURY|nr:hypothetical protein [Halostagnicola larsenii]AHG00943.1 hypothetical protein HALLA_11950 [Halostagnicola larsenii XH-48]AHG00995.1 hypothetical protein HALLA_12265 [Halostagnicola larsenii XH-48]
MTEKFGVSMRDELAERIEETLEYGDSRSDRICELTELGLLLEEVADSHSVELPEDERDRKAFLKQIFIDAEL